MGKKDQKKNGMTNHNAGKYQRITAFDQNLLGPMNKNYYKLNLEKYLSIIKHFNSLD